MYLKISHGVYLAPVIRMSIFHLYLGYSLCTKCIHLLTLNYGATRHA